MKKKERRTSCESFHIVARTLRHFVSAGSFFSPLGADSLLSGVRNVVALHRDPLAFLAALAQGGAIAHSRIGPYQAYLLNDPEYVRELLVTHGSKWKKGPLVQRTKELLGQGLLTSEGEHHLRQRRLMQPLFHRQRLSGYARWMVEGAERCRGRWQDGATLDIHEEMMRLTLAVVGKALFGDDFERDAARIGEALGNLLASANLREEIFTLIRKRLHLPIPAQQRLRHARAILGDVITRLSQERQEAPHDVPADLLSLLKAACDTDGGMMSQTQLLDECATLLLAGHETTASALSFSLFLLSQHPHVEAQLHDELERVLHGRLPTADDVPQLAYTTQVFAETLRLYPPAWMMGRFLTAPISIGGRDFAAGTLMIASPYTMHRDSRFFPDPLTFRPERFTAAAKADRPKLAYFPFGAGPRQCIGEGFAWMEGTLLLATLTQMFTLRLVPGHRVEPEVLITLRPRYGIKMSVHRRPK